MADLIDNSISAAAHEIDVHVHWNGAVSTVCIWEDGRGMDEQTLLNAMRAGGRNPLETRDESDLGGFGFGLKTASFPQGVNSPSTLREGSASGLKSSDGRPAVARMIGFGTGRGMHIVVLTSSLPVCAGRKTRRVTSAR